MRVRGSGTKALLARATPAWHGDLGREIEARLVATARSPVGLRRALACLAGRMLAVRGWERLGFARLEDYAAERVGLSGRELRDLARVDAALHELPGLEAAFLTGRLGWTQVRLLCRVVQPGDEADWIRRAETLSASALAREVRAVDRVEREIAVVGAASEVLSGRETVQVRCTGRVRARWWHTRQVANRVAGRSLPPADFAEALVGEVLSALPLGPEEPAAIEPVAHKPRGEPDHGGPALAPRVPPQQAPRFLAALLEGLEATDPIELDSRLRRAVRLEARTLAEVAGLLAQVVADGTHRELGYRSVDAYALHRLGLSARRARALLRIERAGQLCPDLREAFARGRLSWVQAHALVPLVLEDASLPYRRAWIEHASRVTVRRLRDDVQAALATAEFSCPDTRGTPETPSCTDPAGVQTGANTGSRARDIDRARILVNVPAEVGHLFRAALAAVQRRIEHREGRPSSPGEALETMLEHALDTWEAPQRRVRRTREQRIFERDGWRCTAPGCTSYRNLHAHHVVFRSAGGSDAPSNLTTLCAWHHLRGVHAGRVRCTGEAPHALTFVLGGTRYGPGEVVS